MRVGKLGVGGSGRSPARSAVSLVEGIDLHVQYHSDRSGGDFFDAVRAGSRVAFLLSDIAGRRREADPVAAETQGVFRSRASELLGSLDANLVDGTALLVQTVNLALRGAGEQYISLRLLWVVRCAAWSAGLHQRRRADRGDSR